MSDTLANYSFLPWLRQGLSNKISQADGDASVKLRANISIDLEIKPVKTDGAAGTLAHIPKQIDLYGPGDIVGIDSRAIVKAEPRTWITNFEPNYLAYIEFYEEDFPWRYTPAKAQGKRLRPWLTLVVLTEKEFADGRNVQDRPLPYFTLTKDGDPSKVFPKPEELWAWAHVHANKDLSNGAAPGTADDTAVNSVISSLIASDPDDAYSRIVCPRKLEENTGYHAFLIPSFETGRLAGLGYDIPTDTVATASAWATDNSEFPYYHRWYFRTGNSGDFEYLVNLLKPVLADKKVGVRPIDVLHPGSNLPAIANPELEGILQLGGALRVPFDSMKKADQDEVLKYDTWDENPYPHEFTTAIAKRINLADDYAKAANTVEDLNKEAGVLSEDDLTLGDPDPVITSPLYGRWHALQDRLLLKEDDTSLPHNKNWVHEINLDPRFRIAAGLGTKVIQNKQEEFMQAAWEQVGNIIEANNKIRWAQMAMQISHSWHLRHILPMQNGKAFQLIAPMQKRVMYNSTTVYKQFADSKIPSVVSSGVFRSIVRPRGKFIKRIPFTPAAPPHTLAEKINNDEVVVVPPKKDPSGGINLGDIQPDPKPAHIPALIYDLLKKNNLLLLICLIVMVVFALLGLLFFRRRRIALLCFAVAALAFYLYKLFKKWKQEIKDAEGIAAEDLTPEAVDDIPANPGFVFSDDPLNPTTATPPAGSTADSPDAVRFRAALKDVYVITAIPFVEPERKKIDFADIIRSTLDSIQPKKTIPARTYATLILPPRLLLNFREFFAPVMAYPEIDVPMYKPLADMSSELFLPNLKLIPENSITLLENNQKFIEAYMVGLNHEMSRELLWREYPTDQRGSYLRQFWDVKSFLPPQPVPASLKEDLRDIPKIHTWSRINTGLSDPLDPASPLKNELGQHNHRVKDGKAKLVLVIRGELLKKYPNTVVYAQKAKWGTNTGGTQDVKEERRFIDLSAAESLDPPTDKIKTPLFEAKVDPDVYFFGFDLDDEEARGTLDPTSTADDPGWFFILKERPGEPRFGLDIEKAKNDNGQERLINWNGLSWPDVGTADGECISLNTTITFDPYNAALDQENVVIEDDVQAKWNPNTNAAELAYILYQVPVLVGVHASRMLPK